MHNRPNPRLSGKKSWQFNSVNSLISGAQIIVQNLGNGVWQVSYNPSAPSVVSIAQDFNDYLTPSPSQIAAYGHGKIDAGDGSLVTYTMFGYGDTAGQTIALEIDGQNCGTFTTTAIGGFRLEANVLIRNEILFDCDVYTSFNGAGLSAVQAFTFLRGNQLVLDYGGSKAIDPFFTAGLGNVELTGFSATLKQAGFL
jgi:hypothetical protein